MEVIENGIKALMTKMYGWVETFFENLPNLVLALVIFVVFLLLSRWVYKITDKFLGKTHLNQNIGGLVAGCAKIGVLVVGFVLALGVLKLDKAVFSMLAGVGVVGLALGFAFQDLASNFISGVMIAVRAPIRIGDVIKIGDLQGTVKEIRLRDTIILNFDGQQVFVPNKDFTSSTFMNYSLQGERKITISVGVGYDDNLEGAKAAIMRALGQVERTNEREPAVFVSAFGASSIDLIAHIWIRYPGEDFLGVRDAAIIAIKRALDQAGYTIPFPIRTLELPKQMERKLMSTTG